MPQAGDEGYLCETAANGEEALRQVGLATPDVILCDLVMPGLSGIELISRLANLCPETPDRSARFSRHTERDSASSIYADGEAGVKTLPALVTSCAGRISAALRPFSPSPPIGARGGAERTARSRGIAIVPAEGQALPAPTECQRRDSSTRCARSE